jgi:glycosyltransferase involved in cell wall biosynthesis
MAELPFISVMIPMRNEALHIGGCLESILAQDYPPERMEVLVVDGRSDDDSRAVVEAVGRRDPRVRLLDNPGRIVPGALNIAIRAARGEIIARVDAHTSFDADYLREGVAALERSGADNVGGPMVARGGGPIGDAVEMATRSPFGIGAYFHFGTEDRFVDTVYLGMWPRDVFRRVGLFDEELVRNQDDEFNYRLRKLGGRVFLTPRMRSSYQNRQGLRLLARQFYQYGVWKVRVCQKHPRQMSWRHFVPPAFVLALLLTPVLLWLGSALGVLGALAIAAYALLIGLASVKAARGAEPGRHTRWVPLVFAIIHVAWGLGFLVGLARFGRRWFEAEPLPPQLGGQAAGESR